MKRFYKMVSYEGSAEKGFSVMLDNKPVRTPAKDILNVPSEALAQEIVKEWNAQDKEIIPDTMPLMQILTTAQDIVEKKRDAMQPELMRYFDTDLICYRTEQPEEVARAQAATWDPWVDWFEKKYDGKLKTTNALAAVTQDKSLHDKAEKAMQAMNRDEFTVFQLLTPLVGSFIMALAFIDGAADKDDLYAAANVEENFKAEVYNEDFYGAAPHQEVKQNAMKRDLKAARLYLDLI